MGVRIEGIGLAAVWQQLWHWCMLDPFLHQCWAVERLLPSALAAARLQLQQHLLYTSFVWILRGPAPQFVCVLRCEAGVGVTDAATSTRRTPAALHRWV